MYIKYPGTCQLVLAWDPPIASLSERGAAAVRKQPLMDRFVEITGKLGELCGGGQGGGGCGRGVRGGAGAGGCGKKGTGPGCVFETQIIMSLICGAMLGRGCSRIIIFSHESFLNELIGS